MTDTKTTATKAIGQTATIGRFTAEVVEDALGIAGEPLVQFAGADGRPFGTIRLSTARIAVVVDLYESAEHRLGLAPSEFTVEDYCLDADEITQLREWANRISR